MNSITLAAEGELNPLVPHLVEIILALVVFGLLYRNMNHVVPIQRIVNFLDVSQPGKTDRYTLRMVWVFIRKLRVKLAGKYAIQNARGYGYMMVPA